MGDSDHRQELEMRNVLLVCRGSVEVGLGHIMRTQTVAQALQGSARVHVAVLGDADIARALLGDEIAFSCLREDAEVIRLIDALEPDTVVFDMLAFDPESFTAVRERCVTVCISPIFNCLPEVHLAFSRAAFPEHRRLSRPGGPAIRTGCRYATIGEHCRRIDSELYRANLSRGPLAVAISMGGADAPNKTLRVLESVRRVSSPMLFWVLLGEGYQHSYQALVDCVRSDRRHEIILARTVDSMWLIMSGCSVAILAGGITAYEAAYAGLPSIITLDEADQKCLIQELVSGGAAFYAGAPLEAALDGMVDTLAYLDHNRDVLLTMHTRGQALLDRDGARRIAEEILAFDARRDRIPEVLCA